MRHITVAIGCGLISALSYLLVSAGGSWGGVLLAYFAPFPVFFAGFGGGRKSAAVAAVSGALGVALAGQSLLITAVYALTVGFPVALIARSSLLARTADDGTAEWYPAGRLLTMLLAGALGAFVVAIVATLGQPDGLKGLIGGALDELAQRLSLADGSAEAASALTVMAAIIPGLTGVSWIVMMIVNGVVAQALATKVGVAIRPTPSMAALDMPLTLSLAFAIAALAAFLPDPIGFVGLNAAMVLSIAPAVLGLAVVHAFASARSIPGFVVTGFYVVVFLFGWPILVLIGLGLIEQTMGLRRRWTVGPRQGDE